MSCDDDTTIIYQGDDTAAFGQNFLKINATIPTGWTISKAEVRIGMLPLFTFTNPTFPIYVNPTSEQTKMLTQNDPCYMAAYDSNGKKFTCKGSITIKSKAKVV